MTINHHLGLTAVLNHVGHLVAVGTDDNGSGTAGSGGDSAGLGNRLALGYFLRRCGWRARVGYGTSDDYVGGVVFGRQKSYGLVVLAENNIVGFLVGVDYLGAIDNNKGLVAQLGIEGELSAVWTEDGIGNIVVGLAGRAIEKD